MNCGKTIHDFLHHDNAFAAALSLLYQKMIVLPQSPDSYNPALFLFSKTTDVESDMSIEREYISKEIGLTKL